MTVRGRNGYDSLKEFEREELSRYKKAGWSLDDLYQEASYQGGEEVEGDARELDFDP